jgi:hypothetical protein
MPIGMKQGGQFTNSSGLSNPIYTHHHNDVWLTRQVSENQPGIGFSNIQEFGYLFSKNTVQFGSGGIFILFNPILNLADDFNCGRCTDVSAYQDFFKFIEYIVINFRLSNNGFGKAIKKGVLGFLEAFVQGFLELFLFFTSEKIKKTHKDEVGRVVNEKPALERCTNMQAKKIPLAGEWKENPV